MSFKGLIVGGIAALSLSVAAAPAFAISVAYVTENNPWGVATNEAELTAAFGSFTRLTSFDNAMFSGGYYFIFVDGGDENPNFETWLSGGGTAAAEAWVTGGGALFLNAAPNYSTSGPMLTGFGSAINYPGFDDGVYVTAAGQAVGLDVGAGLNFTGNSFAHSNVTLGAGMVSLVEGPEGIVFASGAYGAGRLSVGGQTTTNFHDPLPNASQLRVNEFLYAANVAAVPEPATWAMMLTGFMGLGVMIRRRRAALA